MRCLEVLSLIGALTMSTRAVAQDAAPPAKAAEPTSEAPAESAPSEAPTEAAPAEAAPAAEAAPPPAPVAPQPPPPPPAPAPVAAPPPAPPKENVLTTPPPPAAEEEEAKKDESETDPMAWIGIGPKVGLIMPRLFARVDRRVAVQYDAQPDTSLAPMFPGIDLTGAGSSSLPVADTITSREGGDTLVSIAVPINLGDGHGISLDLEPTIAFCVSCQKTRGDYTLLAAYAGLAYRFQPIDPLYVSIGFGLRPGIATVKDMMIATQGEARMPFTFTYYVHKSVGLVFEIAPGYGGYVDIFGDDLAESAMQANHALGKAEGRTLTGGIPYGATNPVSGTANALSFAFGGSLDISIGARFP